MEITLEQIETVKDRTGVSYKEAKEALDYANGNVVDAIIYIEDNIDASFEKNESTKAVELKNFIIGAVEKGQANRIKVYKDEQLLINLPLTAGIVGILLFRWWGLIAATLATGLTKCRVELVKEDGSVIDITDKATDAFETVKDKGGIIADEVVGVTEDLYASAKAKGMDFYEAAKDTASKFVKKTSDVDDATVVNVEEGTEEDE